MNGIYRRRWWARQYRRVPVVYGATAVHTLNGAVVESSSDTATGTINFQHYVSGAVVESSTDTATGAISFQHYVSGAVVESGADTATGTIATTSTVSGAVVESSTDTATGTLLGQSWLSGALVESSQDTASGTLDNPEAVVPARPQGGGRPSRDRRRRRYQVEIDGEVFAVSSPDEAQTLLAEAEEVARQQAEQAAERAASAPKRQKRRKLADAAKVLQPPTVRVLDAETDAQAAAIQAQAQAFVDRVQAMYADTLRAIEIGALLVRRLDDDEDEAAELLLMSL